MSACASACDPAAQVTLPVVIKVYDWNRLNNNELVGEVRVPPEELSGVLRSGTEDKREWPILDAKGNQVRGHDKQPAVIVLKLRDAAGQAAPPVVSLAGAAAVKGPGRVEMTIVHGLHLPKADAMGRIDAYCEAKFGEEVVGKTETVKNDFSPHWNTAMTLDVADKTKVGHGRRHGVMCSQRSRGRGVLASVPGARAVRRGGKQRIGKGDRQTDTGKVVAGGD